jgi:hypothetical protein
MEVILCKFVKGNSMSCHKCVNDTCQCNRLNAVNIWSKDYRAGKAEGQRAEALRTSDALIELERSQVISNAQLQAVLDLILEKLTDVADID